VADQNHMAKHIKERSPGDWY